MKSRRASALFELPVETADGIFLARYSETGLASLDFPRNQRFARESQPADVPNQVKLWHRLTSRALAAVLAGKEPAELPPFDISSGTKFQQSVWTALRKIGVGKTRSYSEIAKAIGKPKAVRAVGGACGANRIPVLIPCHRVLAANSKLGGFSGGLDWKRTLLEREGISV